MKKLVLLIVLILIYVPYVSADVIPSLHTVYEDYFDVGVSVEPKEAAEYEDFISEQYNVITIENQMKMNVIHPSEYTYDFRGVDTIVEFAQKHGLKVRAHGLFYYRSTPDWFYLDENGNEAGKELILSRMESHVKTILERYRGKIYAYDVINELVNEEGAWRHTKEYFICGNEYIEKLFQWAHEADPDAVLIYNDNRYQNIEKQDVIFNMIKDFEDRGIPISGIGMQGHMFIDWDLNSIENTLRRFSVLKSGIYITELDMRMYCDGDTETVYPDFMIDDILELQAKKYGSLFDLFREYSDDIAAVSFWNVCDKTTWTDKYYVAGRKHYPLLFDDNCEPKPAFYRVVDFDRALPRWDDSALIPAVTAVDYSINSQTDEITVKGNAGEIYGNTPVTWILFNPGKNADDADGIDLQVAVNNFGQTLTDAVGNYEFTFEAANPIDYDAETIPEFTIAVTVGGKTVTQKILFYTRDMFYTNYRIVDDLNDFSQAYMSRNLKLETDNSNYYDNDTSGLVYDKYTATDGYIMYKMPDNKCASGIIVDSYIYSGTQARPGIYVSADGENFSPLNSQWAEIEKVIDTQNSDANARKHFRFDNSQLPNGIKYITISVDGFDEWWYNYLSRVEISAENCFTSQQPEVADNNISPALIKVENNTQCYISKLEEGNLRAVAQVRNYTPNGRNIKLIAARYEGGALNNVYIKNIVIQSGENCTIQNDFVLDNLSDDTCIKIMLWDGAGNISPISTSKLYE